ncbi:calcium-binding protein [Mesorhizobium sp. CGMCC 1.15528]|uniref:Calcium-binding protein n=1 Tax=Mesorhizobium zhangyense TaxID=1776730 RepID=A0A7C9VEC6_9HYPH|nr:calcium-binding protein [Mesorhizobium zhangyense]NGN45346.1 calcium-binding protein [Mesorhizobium zhangyense]
MTTIGVSTHTGLDSDFRQELQDFINWMGPLTTEKSTSNLVIHKGADSDGYDATWSGLNLEYATDHVDDPTPVAGTVYGFVFQSLREQAPEISIDEYNLPFVQAYHAMFVSIDTFIDLLGDIKFYAGTGDDVAKLGDGNDIFFGYEGNDTFYGMGGNDRLEGGQGQDRLYGGLGNDIFVVDAIGDQTIEFASEGYDTVKAYVDWTMSADIETLELYGSARVAIGNALDNKLFGNWDHDFSDFLDGKAGKDTMYGLDGDDIYVVSSTGDRVIETYNDGTDTVRSYIDWTLGANVERLELLGSTNLIGNGNGLHNTLVGNDGNNILRGGEGSDTLNGGKGSDTLVGGHYNGGDTFVFNTPLGSNNIDKITDYVPFADSFQMENAIFAGLATGWLSVGAFHIGTGAHDATDRIIYNKATGDLYFDKDGLGGAAATKFATLSPGLAMTANDFFIV